MRLEEIQQQLQEQGWQQCSGVQRGQAFCVWRPLSGVPNCQTNDRPPGIMIECYSIPAGDSRLWESCEVKIVGNAGSGQWVKLSVYSILVAELLDKLPAAIETLTACWIAACESQKQK